MFRITLYEDRLKEKWDLFVLNESVNGTFLQTMNFLNYHPKDRFIDESILVMDGDNIAAVIPGCLINENNKRVFYSHKGSTYGGIVIGKRYYLTLKLLEIIGVIDTYLSSKFDCAVLRITPDLFSIEKTDLLQYALYYYGYTNYVELSTYVDVGNYQGDILATFDRNKRRNIKKCIELGLSFRNIDHLEGISGFHNLLRINLSKHNATPIHSLEELYDLKFNRLKDSVQFFGVYKEKELVSAGMMFDFCHKIFHAQNLSYDYHETEYSPISFLYYSILQYAAINGYEKVSWGISTESKGKYINQGLITNKEAYGSKHEVNRTYFKSFTTIDKGADILV